MNENINEKKSKRKAKVRRKARRGSGSIFQQPGTACWTLQYYINGRRVREAAGTDDKQAAQQKLTQRLAAIGKGERVVKPKRVLVSELYAEVERDYRYQKRRSLTELKLRWSHLKPFFENVLAANVDTEMIKNYIDARLAENAASATINRELACLKRAFKLGSPDRMPRFPVKLAEADPRTGFVEDEQFSQLVAHAPELWLRTFLEISYSLGWRVSEIIHLRVKQIDLQKGIIRLDPGTTKNGEGRDGPITPKMRQLLTECIEGKGPEDAVLTRDGNRPVRDFRRRWEKLIEQAKLPNLLIHDFRRSAARALRHAGVAESIIMKIGGWKTASVFRRYAIVSNRDTGLAMEQLEEKRARDEAQREAERRAREARLAENSHSFSRSLASRAENNAAGSTAWKN